MVCEKCGNQSAHHSKVCFTCLGFSNDDKITGGPGRIIPWRFYSMASIRNCFNEKKKSMPIEIQRLIDGWQGFDEQVGSSKKQKDSLRMEGKSIYDKIVRFEMSSEPKIGHEQSKSIMEDNSIDFSKSPSLPIDVNPTKDESNKPAQEIVGNRSDNDGPNKDGNEDAGLESGDLPDDSKSLIDVINDIIAAQVLEKDIELLSLKKTIVNLQSQDNSKILSLTQTIESLQKKIRKRSKAKLKAHDDYEIKIYTLVQENINLDEEVELLNSIITNLESVVDSRNNK